MRDVLYTHLAQWISGSVDQLLPGLPMNRASSRMIYPMSGLQAVHVVRVLPEKDTKRTSPLIYFETPFAHANPPIAIRRFFMPVISYLALSPPLLHWIRL